MADKYPGDGATVEQMRALADEYRKAAQILRQERRSRSPFRLTAIHAVELYLNAFLLMRGHKPALIRGWQHDLNKRAERAIKDGLRLRQRTSEHLSKLSSGQEYLASRYPPERSSTLSELNRLEATLEEVATKVLKATALAQAKAMSA